MRFWDSSALVPLLLEEPTSVKCRALYRADAGVVVWVMTRLEIVSALRRKERGGELNAKDVKTAGKRLDALASRWRQIDELEAVNARAERLLAVHPLRAADSAQLAAALVAFKDMPRDRMFLSADKVLSAAAEREGFDVETV